jgi:hypothetical protein
VENLSIAAQLVPAAAADWRMAAPRPRQSYIVTVVPSEAVTVTAGHALATMLRAARLPDRVSPGTPKLLLLSASTQRRRPALTAWAIHVALTELSRPENPPRPAILAFEETIVVAALDWLETPIVPPPWAAA